MNGHFLDESEGDLCRHGFQSSSWYAGIQSNAQYSEISYWTAHSLAKSSWDGCTTKFLSALVDTASKNLDQTSLAQITPAQLMRKAATVRNTQVTLSGKTPMELAMGRGPRYPMNPAFMNPEQLTSTSTKQDFLNVEIQKMTIQTHLEIQQREDLPGSCWTNEVCSSRSPSGRVCFTGKEIRASFSKDENLGNGWRWRLLLSRVSWLLPVLIPPFFRKMSASYEDFWTLDLEDFLDSCGRRGAPVLWHSCDGQTDVWELFSDNSSLSVILDRQGLVVAVPVDLRTKKLETKYSKKKEVIWQQYRLCLAIAEYQNLGCEHFLYWHLSLEKIGGWRRCNTFRRSIIANGHFLRGTQPKFIFHSLVINMPMQHSL